MTRRVVAVIILVLILGYSLPMVLIGDGTEGLVPEDREFATQALAETRLLLSNPFERLLITKQKVVSVGEDSSAERTATVRAYSLFGIAYAEVEVKPDRATVLWRWFSG